MSKLRQLGAFLFPFIIAVSAIPIQSAVAQDENRVAIVVDDGEGQIETRCVLFEEDEITGVEALARSGLAVAVDYQAGGQAICRIGTTGCESGNCFCQCRGGGECTYWSYWHVVDGEWQYALAGAGMSRVRDGMIEGWSWGPGTIQSASPPPPFTFDQICQSGASGIGDGEVVVTAGPGSQNGQITRDEGGLSSWLPYLAFGLMALLIILLTWLARLRKN